MTVFVFTFYLKDYQGGKLKAVKLKRIRNAAPFPEALAARGEATVGGHMIVWTCFMHRIPVQKHHSYVAESCQGAACVVTSLFHYACSMVPYH